MMPTPDPPKMSRREKERLRHRQEILDAAMALLIEKGFENITMQDIADRAEYAVGSIYRLFAGKNELFQELLLGLWRDAARCMNEALDIEGDELKKLREYNRTSSALTLKFKSLIRVYYGHITCYNVDLFTGIAGEIRRLTNQLIDRLEKLFRSGIKKGLFAKHDPRVLAITYDNFVGSYMTFAFETEIRINPDEWIETVDKIFFHAVLLESAAHSSQEENRADFKGRPFL